MRIIRDSFAHGLAVALLLLAALVLATPRTVAQELQPLTIVTDEGKHAFQVELAATDEDRRRGLMFRRSMPAEQGMLFDFERVAPVSMWMRNTYIPLDMLFIDAGGTIVRIAEDTEPLSERTIPSGQPVLSVLELNAGTARRLRIEAGDRVEHPLFDR
ncbi:DUF192 domain-containing protein [Salinarimonas rosea]|uniref:DUF192 domain-containing protein n=1 Tax=Salinarimonas rosea TaxID=552063 RepID=UPI00048D541B|nr:DUF192 domain-containing protein [Salinarimonas rosea]